MRRIVFLLLSVVLLTACDQGKESTVDGEKIRQYASDLMNRSLYQQAIEQYLEYLENYPVSKREQANINYIVANTYFERLKDYESSLMYYLKIKHFYPESSLIEEVNKRIVACLERLDRPADAQQALNESVALDPDQVRKSRPGAVVAQIGNREITMGDIEFEIKQLPPSLRNEFSKPEQKLLFLREYVATELLYDTAKRAELDKDPEVIEAAFQAKRQIMVRKLLQQRVADRVEVKPEDVELYFQANKEKYAEKDDEGNVVSEPSLQDVQNQVTNDLYQERYQKAYQNLVDRLVEAENVKFFVKNMQ
ncbi:hypothetical protein GF406_02780 [candidate division KSB1 bacterium]|nr:hypothetical protein [candidate division KSB1 bacterium]